MLDATDLAAYLARIGYDGPVAPTRAALNALQLLHPQAIPFENLGPLSGNSPKLDLAAPESFFSAADSSHALLASAWHFLMKLDRAAPASFFSAACALQLAAWA